MSQETPPEANPVNQEAIRELGLKLCADSYYPGCYRCVISATRLPDTGNKKNDEREAERKMRELARQLIAVVSDHKIYGELSPVTTYTGSGSGKLRFSVTFDLRQPGTDRGVSQSTNDQALKEATKKLAIYFTGN